MKIFKKIILSIFFFATLIKASNTSNDELQNLYTNFDDFMHNPAFYSKEEIKNLNQKIEYTSNELVMMKNAFCMVKSLAINANEDLHNHAYKAKLAHENAQKMRQEAFDSIAAQAQELGSLYNTSEERAEGENIFLRKLIYSLKDVIEAQSLSPKQSADDLEQLAKESQSVVNQLTKSQKRPQGKKIYAMKTKKNAKKEVKLFKTSQKNLFFI